MKFRLLFLALTSAATFAFAETPTPPAPGPDAKGTVKNGENANAPLTKSRDEAIRIAIMLKGYADDNGGKLPQKLKDLSPAYFNDTTALDKFELKTPGAELAKISPKTVVLSDSRDGKNTIFAEQIQQTKTVAAEEKPVK
ncbi:hypothetical protein ACXR0O_08400 [Verrucomicrobiota bacterium sgz303538]